MTHHRRLHGDAASRTTLIPLFVSPSLTRKRVIAPLNTMATFCIAIYAYRYISFQITMPISLSPSRLRSNTSNADRATQGQLLSPFHAYASSLLVASSLTATRLRAFGPIYISHWGTAGATPRARRHSPSIGRYHCILLGATRVIFMVHKDFMYWPSLCQDDVALRSTKCPLHIHHDDRD